MTGGDATTTPSCTSYLVPEQVPDVVDAVQDHCGSLQAEPPRDDVDVLGHAHRPQHLGAEHAAVAHL